MANRDMKVSVLVQLVDRLTAPLRGMTNAITGVANRVADLGRRIGVVGAALTALSFMGPIRQAAAWDGILRDIAITAGKSGNAVEQMMAVSGKTYEKLALQTGQYSMDLAKGAQLLIASNMDPALIEKLMPTIARVATATGATIEDTAKTAFSLSDSLKVPADQMESMLGKLVVAGKLGRFEFKNMATEFPALTAQMAKFGITGAEAVEHLGASLQIAMLGTANPSEAANNLKNFLTKINAPEAIKKFEKELKVDVTGVMTDAAAKGINPVEAVIQKMADKLKAPKSEIDKIMKKANASGMSDKDKEESVRKQVGQLLQGTRIGKLYADMQVLDFLIPTLLNLDRLKEFKRQVKEAGVDVIADDFASRMRGLSGQMFMFSEVGTQALRRIGLAFASNLPTANKAMIDLLKWVASIDAKWPGLIDGVLSWTGALLVLGAGLALLTPVVGALAAALGLLLSPIGLIIIGLAALAAGATYVWQNWSAIGPQLVEIWNSVSQAMSDWSSKAWNTMVEFGATLSRAGTQAGQQLVQALIQVDLLTVGSQLAKALADGFSRGIDALLALCAGLPGRVLSAIGSIDLSSIIKLPSWLGGGSSGAPGGPAVDPMGNPTGGPASLPGTGLGGQSGFTRTAGGPAANSNVQVGGRIVVEASEGTRVVNVQSENPAVPVTPNRGTMVARP